MNTYSLSRNIPLSEPWDVIVVGGGPSGCAAAISAAREGAKTLLLEASGALGGGGTSALVPAWCPFSDKEKVIYRGLAQKIFEACKAGMPHVPPADVDWVPIDAERLKRVYDDFVLASGAHLLFNTVLSGVDHDEQGRVRAIIVSNKQGLSALQARVYIDCTGDADLAAWAGAPFHKGDDSGDLMPATHCFVLTNVDEYAFRHIYWNGGRLHAGNPESPIYRIVESGKYPLIPDTHICSNWVGPSTVGFNAGHIWNVDNTDPESVSRGLVQGRKVAKQLRDALAEYCPEAFAASFLCNTAPQIGVRESRRIDGDYTLTLDDYMARRSFPDEIVRNCYFIDVHHSADKIADSITERREPITNAVYYGPGESHGIPYRCLVPKKLQNVLVAGRSISCERAVQGSVRVMPVCLAMGEAAGMAAAHAVQSHCGDVRAVDTARLRHRLQEEGGYLPEPTAA
ncbi:MAG: FAD-dependent oxidoreductase [Chthoniobacteraceae bacterium]|nr:FAD-dependent oxidoreductase [Chthoniobacteraceae bacterium]